MKYLIVNGDDFGASRGVNRGIMEVHARGALTSASLMIAMPAAREAVALATAAPDLGVGLHVALTNEDSAPLIDFDDAHACAAEIEKQIDRFCNAMGSLPTHLDTHQNVHRDERLRPLFVEAAARYDLPLREHSPVRYFSNFYGQWDDIAHPEQISIESLTYMLREVLQHGITELSCHPGYMGPDFTSPYNIEREIEIRTLCDPQFLQFLRDNGVQLINFGDVPTIARQMVHA
ncbi:MAG: ChbG/HpnK family deacetylase [Candidatus Eremiobacteraeota bacterium]|nr:ChbG/HpnK family deacetylase [Candidatus Eremiobacteraeota bacterium]